MRGKNPGKKKTPPKITTTKHNQQKETKTTLLFFEVQETERSVKCELGRQGLELIKFLGSNKEIVY